MSYAVIETGGKQFKVTKGQTIRVPVLQAEPGASVQFSALLSGSGAGIQIGLPAVEGLTVHGKVVEHGRATKIIVFKKKRKKQYKKTHGHRQNFTAVLIESIGDAAETESSSTTAVETASAPAAETAAPAAKPAEVEAEAEAEPTEVNTQITDSVTSEPEAAADAETETTGDKA
ncbi:MAG TPA: 50S ribosomal protein L21 [Blastocatellia bacterium]